MEHIRHRGGTLRAVRGESRGEAARIETSRGQRDHARGEAAR